MKDDPPPEAIPELGLSKQDVINFREWLAAGSPRYWKGENMFPHLNDEQWLEYRIKARTDPRFIETMLGNAVPTPNR